MRTIGWLCLPLWLLICLAACTHPGGLFFTGVQEEKTTAARFLALARQCESDDPAEALSYLKVAAALEPENRELALRVETLAQRLEREAAAALKKANLHREQNDAAAMLAALLTVLRLQPDNEPALKMLDEYRAVPKPTVVVVKAGDSLASIARAEYGNPEFKAILALFNGLKPDVALQPGLRLRIPPLQPSPESEIPTDSPKIGAGFQLAENGRFAEAVAVAEKILDQDYLHQEAVTLRDHAAYEEGRRLMALKQYEPAVNFFSKVDPGYKDIESLLKESQKLAAQQKQAAVIETDFKTAVRHLNANELGAALDVIETLYVAKADHRRLKELQNRTYFMMGNDLATRGKYLQAQAILRQVDPGYEGVQTTLSRLKNAMAQEAEVYYLEGVKRFLEERLKEAVEAWQLALKLDPDHPKAAQDIQNANKIIDKLKIVE
jgi:tetratricopeptide (TPR) repeat protein